MADSADEKSDGDDEFVADVEDEFSEAITLPDLGTKISAHEREPELYLDEDLSEVSVTNTFPVLLSFLGNTVDIMLSLCKRWRTICLFLIFYF